ncbi:hypothetical protein MAY30_24315, partial [Escherichia coli]
SSCDGFDVSYQICQVTPNELNSQLGWRLIEVILSEPDSILNLIASTRFDQVTCSIKEGWFKS